VASRGRSETRTQCRWRAAIHTRHTAVSDDAQKLTLASSQVTFQLARKPDRHQERRLDPESAPLRQKIAPAPAPRPKVVKAPKVDTPPPSTGYKVQVIRGNKVDETKFPDQGAH
jgi:hypothetical protein